MEFPNLKTTRKLSITEKKKRHSRKRFGPLPTVEVGSHPCQDYSSKKDDIKGITTITTTKPGCGPHLNNGQCL